MLRKTAAATSYSQKYVQIIEQREMTSQSRDFETSRNLQTFRVSLFQEV